MRLELTLVQEYRCCITECTYLPGEQFQFRPQVMRISQLPLDRTMLPDGCLVPIHARMVSVVPLPTAKEEKEQNTPGLWCSIM